MSIQSNIAAERAAREIREFAESLEKMVTDPEATWVISQVVSKADEIIETAEAGWY